MKKPEYRRILNWAVIVLVSFVACFFFNSDSLKLGSPAPAEAGFFNFELETFDETLTLISENYVYPPDFKKIFTAAINEMIKKTGPENLTVENSDTEQSISRNGRKLTYQLDSDRNSDYRAMKKVYAFLIDEFKGKVSKQDLETAGIAGVVSSLDPYSQYLDKDAFERSMRDTEGQYGGLGMVITMKDNKLIVVKTMKSSPAERAGIMPDDIIMRVDGKDVTKLHIEELANALRGYQNTQVAVTIFRPSTKVEKISSMTREIILVESVTYKSLGDHTAYLKINSFSKQTDEQLKESLEKAKQDDATAYVIDLRDNPGGLLDQSVKVTSRFLGSDQLVVYTQGRKGLDRRDYRSLFSDGLSVSPIAILINQYSASASEIVAGALRDLGRALIIGETSYGKGSVQTIFRLGDNSGLRLTTSKYYTPSGTDISEHGIAPEIRIFPDMLEEKNPPASASKSQQAGKYKRPQSPINLKQSEVEKFLTSKGLVVSKENDPTLLFAHMVVKNLKEAGQIQTLERARELAANIHY